MMNHEARSNYNTPGYHSACDGEQPRPPSRMDHPNRTKSKVRDTIQRKLTFCSIGTRVYSSKLSNCTYYKKAIKAMSQNIY
mmetsp:Transcript_5416/g.12796  ORF Transcript_5416/g.12796 Transcript_5416/m.12796 type:complete len:81 (-) Transcript_5416:846-1088(-)